MKYADAKRNSQGALPQGAGYAGSGDPLSTQDRMAEVDGKEAAQVYREMVIRPIDRQPKDMLTLQTALMAMESVYYPNQERMFDLYDDIRRDGFLRGIIRKLIAQIINKNLLFKKGGKEFPLQYKDAKKTDVIRSKSFRNVCREILHTPFWLLTF